MEVFALKSAEVIFRDRRAGSCGNRLRWGIIPQRAAI